MKHPETSQQLTPTILISACLMGQKVRYDGQHQWVNHPWLQACRKAGLLVPICPEVAGGLSVPRPPAEIQQGTGASVLVGTAKVETNRGADVTQAFVQGAQRTLRIAQKERVGLAILKAKSPSCGSGIIYNGNFDGRVQPGWGVAAALLRRQGIAVYDEHQLEEAEAYWRGLPDAPSHGSVLS